MQRHEHALPLNSVLLFANLSPHSKNSKTKDEHVNDDWYDDDNNNNYFSLSYNCILH